MILASSLITDLDNLWGPHTCDRDRFVCPYETRKFSASVPDFINPARVAWMLSPKIGLTINWLCPPVYLRCKVVRHMKLFSVKGALVVPIWRSAHFWPVLCSDGVHWSNFIHDWVILSNFPNLFIACKAKNSILVTSLYRLFQLPCVLT